MKNILFYDVIHIHVTVTTKNTTPPPRKILRILKYIGRSTHTKHQQIAPPTNENLDNPHQLSCIFVRSFSCTN